MTAVKTLLSSSTLLLLSLLGSSGAYAYSLDQWIQSQSGYSTQAMLANIGPTASVPEAAVGAVAASPSRDPNYRYHWVRDAALVMDTVLGLYEHSHDAGDRSHYLDMVYKYADFSRQNQTTSNPSGPGDDLGIGEPKFNLDGTAYQDPWGRPQNDGPALRASTLIRFAHLLLDQGKADYVRQKLYDSRLPARTVIKADLEFVSHHWRDSSFDLWEEVKGKHFYTRMVQRRALIEGARLAERLSDWGAAEWYRSQARALEPEIARHWDPSRSQIHATLDRDAGLDYKSSGLDVAVVLGALHGEVRGSVAHDSFFDVTDDRVLATAEKIQESFKKIYAINARERDWENQTLGVAIGRYPEDQYSGTSFQQTGNPWFLATNAFAELYYRCAQLWESQGKIRVTASNAPLFGRLHKFARMSSVQPGEIIQAGDPRFYVLVRGLRQLGDDFLRRTHFHADPSGALSEQMNRDSGYMQSAGELTWSHASLLTAAWAR